MTTLNWLEWLVARWDEGRGATKSQLECLVWDGGAAHGRHFDRFVRQVLGIATTDERWRRYCKSPAMRGADRDNSEDART